LVFSFFPTIGLTGFSYAGNPQIGYRCQTQITF
jgi:hypothetical protein